MQEPEYNIKAEEERLLEWIERHEQDLEPDTLGHWVGNRILECLEAEEDDTVGILGAIEDIKAQCSKAKCQGAFFHNPAGQCNQLPL